MQHCGALQSTLSLSSHAVVTATMPTRTCISTMTLCLICLMLLLSPYSSSALSTIKSNITPRKIVLLGGTGKIGTAVATHLLRRSTILPDIQLVLVGRNSQKGHDSVQEVLHAASQLPNYSSSSLSSIKVEFECISNVWDANELASLFQDATAVIHTAGPYQHRYPVPLRTAIDCHVPVYVDVADPLEYLDESLKLNDAARTSGTAALIAAGAFPGLSNLLAMEAAQSLPPDCRIQDVGFNYFTAGLGGSGNVNLEITNLGFGESMPQYEKGKLRFYSQLPGKLLGKVDFFTNEQSPMAKRVGRQTVFSWPFPEAATVPRQLGVSGRSHAAMGTAPDAWNVMLGLLVNIVPRSWWRNQKFSKFMADFSQPLVAATDVWLKWSSVDGVGETHAMRIDVTATCNNEDGTGNDSNNRIIQTPRHAVATIVQGHESFRQCVGQSCAEFCIDLMEQQMHQQVGGVALVEQRYQEKEARLRMVERMTKTPGTIDYSGPVVVSNGMGKAGPSNMDDVLAAMEYEVST